MNVSSHARLRVRVEARVALAWMLILAGWWGMQHAHLAPSSLRWTASLAGGKSASPALLDFPPHLAATPAGKIAVAHFAPDDLRRYQTMFALQKAGHWKRADAVMRGLRDKALVGYLLASRYLDARYAPSPIELRSWLYAYRPLPEAPDALARMRALYPARAARMPELPAMSDLTPRDMRPPPALRIQDQALWKKARTAYAAGDSVRSLRLSTTILRRSKGASHAARFLAGLSAWRMGEYARAAGHFRRMADAAATLAEDHASAAAYWAYRALAKTEGGDARAYLNQAAAYPHAFYGMVARARLGQPALLASAPPPVNMRAALKASPALREIVLLKTFGEHARAAERARRVFASAAPAEKNALLHLADAVRLLPAPRGAKPSFLLARAPRYPVPTWVSGLRREDDAALILAIVRQESGFNPTAGSSAGAQGLMQIMPETAAFLRRREAQDAPELKLASYDPHDAEDNLRLGQAYLRHLRAQPYIGSDLVRLLAAYNAGPGTVARWREGAGMRDPLLYIESFPFPETREYVKNVLRDYWVYGAMLPGAAKRPWGPDAAS